MENICLAGCVILKEDSILLLHRIKRDQYELPGGKIDEGESAEETAVREIKEELCCDIEIVRRLGGRDFEEDGHFMSYNWFLASITDGATPKIGEPHAFDDLIYIPLDRLNRYRLSPNMRNLYAEIQAKKIIL